MMNTYWGNLMSGYSVSDRRDSKRNAQDRRLHQRLRYKTEVIFFSELRSYRTETLDISQSGIKIETYVPFDFMNRTIDVVLVMTPITPNKLNPQKEFLKFRGVMVAGNRAHFLTDLHDSTLKLARILVDMFHTPKTQNSF